MQQSNSLFEPPKYDALDAHLHLGVFIEKVLYPAEIKAGSSEWHLGRVHLLEWSHLAYCKRARILGPRDHLKSFFFIEAKSLHHAWNNDVNEILIVGLSDKKAAERLENIKKYILRVPELQHLADEELAKKNGVEFRWAVTEVVLSSGLKITAQGYASSLRGGHPDIILMDDIIDLKVIYSNIINEKSVDRFYAEVVPMAQPSTQILMVGTIQRKDDLYHTLNPKSWILKTYSAIIDEEKKICLFPEFWSWDKLMERRDEITYNYGRRFWLKEYENNVTAMEGQIFKEEWMIYVPRKDLPKFVATVNGWDLAVKRGETNKYTAGISISADKDNVFYITDVRRGQFDLDQRLDEIENFSARTGANEVAVEDNVFQEDTVQLLRKRLIVPVRGITSVDNKIARAESNAIYFMPPQQRMRIVCEGFNQDGLPILSQSIRIFMEELLSAPGGYFDQIDSLDLGIRCLTRFLGMKDQKTLYRELSSIHGKSYWDQRSF